MSGLAIAVLLLLVAIETLAAYISRIYAEFGKILSREMEQTLDTWEERIEPHLGLSREHAGLCAAVLQQFALALIALDFGIVLFRRMAQTPGTGIGEILLALVLIVTFSNQFIPSLLLTRTQGAWAARILWLIRILLWLATPVTVFIRFFYSIASLAEHPIGSQEEPAPDVDALI